MLSTNTSAALEKAAAGLTEKCIEWRSKLRCTDSVDRELIATSLKQLYEILEKPEPQIVWCQSPWQIAAMVSVLRKQMTRNAIKKWDQQPVELRTSENDYAELWKCMWNRLEAQLSEEKRDGILSTDADTDRKASAKWSESWLSKVPGAKQPVQKSIWKGIVLDTKNEWLRLARGMRAGCAVRLENDATFKAMETQYRQSMTILTERSQFTQLQLDLAAFGTAGFGLATFERISRENLLKFGVEALKGHAAEEFDKLCTPEDRKAFEFSLEFMLCLSLLLSPSTTEDITPMIPFYDFLCDELPELPIGPTNRKRAKTFLNLLWQTRFMMPFDKVVFVCERPLAFEQDAAGRLHSAEGPAVAFSDGLKLYSWHGVTVSKRVIENPESLTTAEILKQWNAEVRRIMIERFGLQNFIERSGAVEVSRDEFGILYRKELTNDEPLVMVKVINSTAEPDGTFKAYFLRVPPSMQTAREAVAWTFEVDSASYAPEQET